MQLKKDNVAFIQLAKSSGEYKTFIHEFILFQTNNGVVRLDSYGKDQILTLKNGKIIREKGYILYCSRIFEWSTWGNDIRTSFK